MPNTYFQFKEFTINQDRCSMKVCTDACLFGAWVASGNYDVKNMKCLDIGAGTGLLSLMVVQKNPGATIEAVEIESNATKQAAENFAGSPWSSHLKVIHTDINDFDPDIKYDLIFSNPPFYENELVSPVRNKNIAKHDHGLKLDELFRIANKHLSPDGTFAVLLPYHRVSYAEELAKQNNFFLAEKMIVRQTPMHEPFRGMLLFSKNDAETNTGEMTIKSGEEYSREFKELLGDYYLYM